jgi:two-component system sensor histidine kinase ChvG
VTKGLLLLRPSLRTNAALTVLAMLLLPLAIVGAWSAMERDIAGKLQWSTGQAAGETAEVIEDSNARALDDAALEERVTNVAERWGARIRVVRADGTVVVDVDRDKGTDVVHRIGMLFFGRDGAPTLREYDDTLEPVQQRPEVVRVTNWHADPPPQPHHRPIPAGTAHTYSTSSVGGDAPPYHIAETETGCRRSPADKLLVCHAARAAKVGDAEVAVYTQESSRRAVRALYDLRYQLLRLSLLMLPVALAFSWWMGRRMVKPIEDLRDRVLEKARSANPRADLPAQRGDEAADLAEAFNDLLGSLDEKRRENEAFVADLVHEFKNPVAAIRACAESLDAGGVDEKRAQRMARILADSSQRLDGLVSQFLELARAEAGMPNEARADVDLAALAKGVVSTFESRNPELRFVVTTEGEAKVRGVESRLDSLVRNLVDNAASFAGENGEVRVSVEAKGARVVLEVSDTGPGIAEGDLPRMFERFFTTRAVAQSAGDAPAARKEKKGTGLGLALVKAVAEAHGGEASARNASPHGATFRVILPRRSSGS